MEIKNDQRAKNRSINFWVDFFKEEFIAECLFEGLSLEQAESIWTSFLKNKGYNFNLNHLWATKDED